MEFMHFVFLMCQVRVTVGDSGLCGCVCVICFSTLVPRLVDSAHGPGPHSVSNRGRVLHRGLCRKLKLSFAQGITQETKTCIAQGITQETKTSFACRLGQQCCGCV